MVNLYDAICWLTQSWQQDVANATTDNYFPKSTVINPTIPHLTMPEAPELTALYSAVEEVSGIQYLIRIKNFLNLEDKDAIEKPDENGLMASLLADDLPQANEEALEEWDNEVIEAPEPLPSVSEAITAVQTAFHYAEWSDWDFSIKDTRELERLERQFGRLSIEKQHQTTLDSF